MDILRGGAANRSIDPICQYCSDLLYRMSLTKGARFQSAKRHSKRSVASMWAVTMLSLYVFSVSAVLAIYDMKQFPGFEKPLIITSIIMSAFIIAFSVMEQGGKHDLKAELFLRCAQRIQGLTNEIEFNIIENICDAEKIRSHINEYNKILNDFPDNHSDSDFMTHRINIGKEKDKYITNFMWRFAYWYECWKISILSVLMPPATLYGIFLVIGHGA